MIARHCIDGVWTKRMDLNTKMLLIKESRRGKGSQSVHTDPRELRLEMAGIERMELGVGCPHVSDLQ